MRFSAFFKIYKICITFHRSKLKISAIFTKKIDIEERCKGVHCVDLGESFPTHIFLQNLASIQPRTSPVKFARSSAPRPEGAVRVLRLRSRRFVSSVRFCLCPHRLRSSIRSTISPSSPGTHKGVAKEQFIKMSPTS